MDVLVRNACLQVEEVKMVTKTPTRLATQALWEGNTTGNQNRPLSAVLGWPL